MEKKISLLKGGSLKILMKCFWWNVTGCTDSSNGIFHSMKWIRCWKTANSMNGHFSARGLWPIFLLELSFTKCRGINFVGFVASLLPSHTYAKKFCSGIEAVRFRVSVRPSVRASVRMLPLKMLCYNLWALGVVLSVTWCGVMWWFGVGWGSWGYAFFTIKKCTST